MGQHWALFGAVAAVFATDVAPEYEELARRRLRKMGVVFLEDDDAVNIQSAPCVSNELAPPHLVPARRCIDEIYKYSLCLQTSACPTRGAKATHRATTERCEGAPTDAAITQLVEERVRATGDDEATARAYLTSYDLCAKWGDEETKQPERIRRTRENCPAGCDYVTNCQYAPEVWDPVYNWTSRKDGVFRQVNRTTELHLLDDDDAEAMCDRVYSTTKPWSCAWGDATDGLGAAPMRWADNNEGGDDDSPQGVSFNLEHKINACGCQFWDALSCQIAHRCGGTLAEGQKVWLENGENWHWRDVPAGTQLLGGGRMTAEADMRPTPCLDVCASSSAVATTMSVLALVAAAAGVVVMTW